MSYLPLWPRPALGGAWTWTLALLTAALLLSGNGMRGTLAQLNARTTNPSNTLALTALYPPPGLTATAAGYDVGLSWSAGQNGSGYNVLGASAGASSSCNGLTLSSIGVTSTQTYTDSSRSVPQGAWYCYQVQTTYGPWTSVQN